MIAEAICVISAATFLLYWRRMVTLRFRAHDWTFVAQNVLSGMLCIYSAYDLWANGLDVLPVLASMTAALYLVRSRDTYKAVTAWTPQP